MSKVGEKKLINDKIAKVREVVHGVSTNDIILALYSFDMDVERTIQAFCEDGASEVLDDWVRPSGASAKNRNKKKKKNKQSQPEAGSVAPNASLSNVTKTTLQGSKPEVASTNAQPVKLSSQSNGFLSRAEPADTKGMADKSTSVAEHIQQTFKVLRSTVAERENALLAMCGAHSKFVDADFNHLILLIQKFGSVVEIPPQERSPPQTTVGLPKTVSPVQAAVIKHATSQSSISSSLGADSGVNLSPTHNEDKAPPSKPAKVANGGIQMQSDVLSPDQLEALQRSLAEQLAAFGIDASVLSGVTGGNMPVRRTRRLDASKKGLLQYRNEKASIHPQLSIL